MASAAADDPEAVSLPGLARRRDEAERASVAAWLSEREHIQQAAAYRQEFARERALANRLAAVLQRNGIRADQILEPAVMSTDAVEAVYQPRLTELDARLADAAQYAVERFAPQDSSAAPAPAQQPSAARAGTISLEDWRKK